MSCYSFDYFQLHILRKLGVETWTFSSYLPFQHSSPPSAEIVHSPMPCIHTNQFCTLAVREKKCSYSGCSRKEVLEPSATTTLLIHDDWQTMISFRESVIGMQQQRVKKTVVGSPSVVIQAEGYLATCYASGCETWDHLPQSTMEWGVQLVSDQEKILRGFRRSPRARVCRFALQIHTLRGKVLRPLQQDGLYPYHYQSVQVCRHSKPNPQLERIPVTGLGIVATRETWCVLWVGRLHVTWDNNSYNTQCTDPINSHHHSLVVTWCQENELQLKQFLRSSHTGKV